MLKVGTDLIFDKKKGKERKISYADIPYDEDGWVDSSKFLPADFDLVYLKSPNHIKTVSGWWSGKIWDGLNIAPDDEVLYWKRNE